jgi:hypothetical protein
MSESPGGEDARSDPDVPAEIRYDPDLAVHEPAEVPAHPIAPSRRRSPLLLFAMAIVALSVGVYVIFGLIAREGRTSTDLLNEIRLGNGGAWQAAFELSRLLPTEDPRRRGERFAPDLVAVFERSRTADPRLRRYLALALGELGDRRAVDSLSAALRDPDPDARLYAVWALGAIGDKRAAPILSPLLESEDPGVRKVAAYALGAMAAPEAAAALRGLLNDPVEDVAWNAALALARLGDDASLPLLARMIDRRYLDTVRQTDDTGRTLPLSEERKEEAMINALRSIGRLGDRTHLAALRAVRDADPSLRVRQVAREAIDQMKSGIHY